MARAVTGAVVVFAGRASIAVLSLAYLVLIPRALGPESYGFYNYWFAQIFLLMTVLDLGSSEMLKRYLPHMLHRRSGEARTLVRDVLVAKALLLPLALLVVPLHEQPGWYLLILAAGVLGTWSWITSDIHYAAGNMGRYSLYHLLRKLVRLVLLLALFPLAGNPGIIVALVASEMLLFVLFLVLSRDTVPRPAAALPRPFLGYAGFGLVVYLATVLYMLTARAPVLLAKELGFGYAEIAYLALAIDICYFGLRELFYALSESVQPAQALEHAAGRMDRVARSIRASGRFTLMLMLPCLIALWFLLDPVLALIGEGYAPAAPLVAMFLPVVAFNTLAFIHRQALIIAERQRGILLACAAGFAAFVLAVALPGPVTVLRLGAAVVAGSAVQMVLMRVLAGRCLDLRGELSDLARVAASGAVFLVVCLQFDPPGWLGRVAVLVPAGLAYAAVLVSTGALTRDDLIPLRRRLIR